MKFSGAKADRFIADPGGDVAVVLLFGPDQGLISERADLLAKKIAGALDDPFSVVSVTPQAIKAAPSRLADERAAIGFGGGRRVIKVPDAADSVTAPVEAALARETGDGIIILMAGALSPRSRLRKLCEQDKGAAAIGCYPDDARSAGDLIRNILGEHGLTASRDAQAYLVQHLGSDRRVSRGELDKLALYMSDSDKREVSLDDASAIVGDTAASAIDALVNAALTGDAPAMDRQLAQSMAEGVGAVQIIRAVQRACHRLHLAAADMASGKSASQAVDDLRPPVIFKDKPAFAAALRRLPLKQWPNAIHMLSEAEMACKTTGALPEAVCHRALLRLAASGGRR